MEYAFSEIEKYARKFWADSNTYKVENKSEKPKYYVLDMFPYPSGAGLHVGHPLGYIASDIFARYKRMKGFNVLHPMGFDAFGLPAEQYAIQTGIHPAVSTAENLARYREQLDNLGFSFDWSRQVSTCDPKYYRFTQEIFLLLFGHYYDTKADKALSIDSLVATFAKEGNANVQAVSSQEEVFSAAQWNAYTDKEKDDVLMNYRLAYRKVGSVNWCEELGTVLANDEVKDGLSERGGYPVIQKPMVQWALRISAYADRLLSGLDTVDFSEALKTQQRNWIGKSEGSLLDFKLANDPNTVITVFTTRPDTVFGVSFMVLAPEHPLVAEITTQAQQNEVNNYLEYTKNRTERERQAEAKKVTGAFTGAYVAHPFTGAQVPVYISEYVLMGYGTGAIMAVPAHDERDERFAKHFSLPINKVVEQPEGAEIGAKVGKMINSDFLNGLEVKKAIAKAIDEIESRGLGQRQVNFRLRDANYSRQRYWGEPFPIRYTEEGVAVVDKNLPVELPTLDDYRPTSDGRAPLARREDWITDIPGLRRETDTMPGFAGSSWYFLRYMDALNEDEMFSKEAVNYWQDVDLYVGGSEHAVGHLLYSRMWHKFLYDLGKVPTQEPFKKLVNQGMIQGIAEQIVMMKEKDSEGRNKFVSADLAKNLDPESYVLMPIHIDFVSDYGQSSSYVNPEGLSKFKEWRPDFANAILETNAQGNLVTVSEVGKMSKRLYNVVNPDSVIAIYGSDCFRMYEMFLGPLEMSKPWDTTNIKGTFRFLQGFWKLFYDRDTLSISDEAPNKDELKVMHTCIKKITEDIERMSFNTCISAFMICVNDLKKLECRKRAILTDFVKLIAPFAPHVAEYLWQQALGNAGSVTLAEYPTFNEAYLVSDTLTYAIATNGKRRAEMSFAASATKDEVLAAVLADESVLKYMEGKPAKNVIFVPGKMVNIVI